MATSNGLEGRVRRERALRYLGSAKNIVGSLLALGGLGLFFAGAINRFWWFIVAGLYAIGALVAPSRRVLPLLGGVDPADIQGALDKLRREIQGKVPDDVFAKVDAIEKTVQGILPRAGQVLPGSQDLFVLERTATDYLPTAVEGYLKLTPEYANTQKLEGGKTAKQILTDQLDLLGTQMEAIADAVNRNDADRLLAHGRFLEERFGKGELSIDDAKTGTDTPPPTP